MKLFVHLLYHWPVPWNLSNFQESMYIPSTAWSISQSDSDTIKHLFHWASISFDYTTNHLRESMVRSNVVLDKLLVQSLAYNLLVTSRLHLDLCMASECSKINRKINNWENNLKFSQTRKKQRFAWKGVTPTKYTWYISSPGASQTSILAPVRI